jgi:ATP-dependent RNA helicase DDX46/PRP5
MVPQEFGIVVDEEEDEEGGKGGGGGGGADSDEDIRPIGTAAAAAAAAAATAAAAASAPLMTPALNGAIPVATSAANPAMAAAAAAAAAAVSGGGGASAPSALKFLPAQPGQVFPGQAVPQDNDSIRQAALEAARAAAQKLGGDPSQPGLLAAAQQAAMRAAALAAAFAQTPGGAAGAQAAAAGAAGLSLANLTAAQQQRLSGFEVELEINDFPQQARWKVTHKGFQAEITELTGAAVTTKGIYVKSGGVGVRAFLRAVWAMRHGGLHIQRGKERVT